MKKAIGTIGILLSLLTLSLEIYALPLLQYTEDMRPADLADFIHSLPHDRKMAVAQQLTHHLAESLRLAQCWNDVRAPRQQPALNE